MSQMQWPSLQLGPNGHSLLNHEMNKCFFLKSTEEVQVGTKPVFSLKSLSEKI